MSTQAQVRQTAKERVRTLKRSLKRVDTKLEILERRLDKLLERQTLITTESFDSFLKNYDGFVNEVGQFEVTLTEVLILFSIN